MEAVHSKLESIYGGKSFITYRGKEGMILLPYFFKKNQLKTLAFPNAK
jgi:hypothetical protein